MAAVATTLALRRALGIPTVVGGSLGGLHPLAIYATILWHYFAQLVTVDNGPAVVSFRLLAWPAVVLVYVVLVAILVPLVGATRSGGRRAALALFGVLWFLVSLVPHVVSLPAFGVYGNRYAYFPLMGLLVVGAVAVNAFAIHARQPLRRLAVLLAGVIVVVASARTAAEARAWNNDLSLFGHRLDAEDGEAVFGHASALLRRYGCRAALPEIVRAVELAPDLGPAWHNLAGCLLSTGRYEQAVAAAERALAFQPGVAGAEYNLGAALVFTGQAPLGLPHLENAARLDPHHALTARLLAQMRAASAKPVEPTAEPRPRP